MAAAINVDRLIGACSDESFDAGIHIDAVLSSQAGDHAPVKPAIYEGGRYQIDRRWPGDDAEEPVEVIVIDNVPSQANRLEAALERYGSVVGLPELQLDLSGIEGLPVHLPTKLSSFRFSHRNADAYLRDSQLDGTDFRKTEIGKAIEKATPERCGALVAWFPQSLLFGFWQSHLGKHRQQTKLARAWTSQIVGWRPAATEISAMGLKGDALNLTRDVDVTSDPDDRTRWVVGKEKLEGATPDRLSEIGHGQVPFMRQGDAAPAAISFERITQPTTLSFSQLRKLSLGDGRPDADAAMRAVAASIGLFAHAHAFNGGFSLRSGADLRTRSRVATFLGETPDGDLEVALPTTDEARALVAACVDAARSNGVPLDGWDQPPLVLEPKDNLRAAIEKTWPGVEE